MARDYISRNYNVPILDTEIVMGYFQPVQSSADPKLIGVIATGGEYVKDFIIVHECAHAVFHWFVRTGHGTNVKEEEFADRLGKLSAAVLRDCLESYPQNELLPGKKGTASSA